MLLRVPAALAGAALFALAISTTGASKPVPCADVHVDAGTWRTEHQRSLVSRSPTDAERLASELVRCRVLLGSSSARVRRLLGRPDQVGDASERRSSRRECSPSLP